MEDEDSQGATPMAPHGDLLVCNESQRAVLRNSPPRLKRVFVLAETSRSQTNSFIPAPQSRTHKGIMSPSKSWTSKNTASSSAVSRVGCQIHDDATFLALLHIEPMVDRDLFRALCDDLSANGNLGMSLNFAKSNKQISQDRPLSYQDLRSIRPDIGNCHLTKLLEGVSRASESLWQDSIFKSTHAQSSKVPCSVLFHAPSVSGISSSNMLDSSIPGSMLAIRHLPSPYHSALPASVPSIEPTRGSCQVHRGFRSLHLQHNTFAARLMKPGCHRNMNSVLLMREVLGERTPQNVMSRLEMKRFSTCANLLGHCDAVYCLAVNSSNTIVLTGSDDYRVKSWSICPVAGVGLISTMRGHQGVITQVMFNPQDEEIAISCDSSFCAVRFWRISNGQQLRLIISHEYNGREDVFFDLQNFMNRYLITTTRNEIKFWNFSSQQQRLTLDERGDPELHRPEFEISLPQNEKGKHIGIIAMHPSLPIALVATDSGSLYLITMLQNAGISQFVALRQDKEPLYSKEITELSWNSSGTCFVVSGKNWDSPILIVPFKYDSARCFIAAASNEAKDTVAYWNKEAVPKREPGGPKTILLETLVCTKSMKRIDLKSLEETMMHQEKIDDLSRTRPSKGFCRTRPISTGCKEITCIAWSREGARIIVGCCPISLVGAQRSAVISKAVVRVFCSLTASLLVSFDQIHDRPISSIIAHPSQHDIFMTASYDGDVKICDISAMHFESQNFNSFNSGDATFRVPSLPFNVDGCKIMQTFNGKPQISEACWQRNDTIIVARKSGHISLINAVGIEDVKIRDSCSSFSSNITKKWRCRVLGNTCNDQVLPEDHFFLFEKRKLKWDQWGTAVDEVTEARTHLMPRGPLCNRHYESYDAFGFDSGVWQQVPFESMHDNSHAAMPNFGNQDAEDDDDEILVQPLPAGNGRRTVDLDSESSDSYSMSEDSEVSETSGSLSSNEDWSQCSSGDDTRKKRKSSRSMSKPSRKNRKSSSNDRSFGGSTSRPTRSRKRSMDKEESFKESLDSDSDSRSASSSQRGVSARFAKGSSSRPKTLIPCQASSAAFENKQRRFGVDVWSIPAPRLVGAAEGDRKWLSKSKPPIYLDEVYVPQIGDVVHYFRTGHAKARSKRDSDPARQILDDSVAIMGKDLAYLPYRIKGTVQKVTPRIWIGRKLDAGVSELKHCNREFHIVLEVFILADNCKVFSVVYHSEDQWLVPDWLYIRNAARVSAFMEGGFRIKMRFEDAGESEGTIPKRRLTRGSVPHLEDEWLAHDVTWDSDNSREVTDATNVDDTSNCVSHWEVVVQGEDGTWLQDPPLPRPVPGAALIALIDSICEHPIALGLFDNPVNLKDCPEYTDSAGIALPMDLSLIRMRLVSGYYRSLDAVLADVDLMTQNAHLYNDEELSSIPAFAEAVFCVINQHIMQMKRQNLGEDDQPMQLELEDNWERSIWSQELRPTQSQYKKCLSRLKQCDKYKAFGAPVDDNDAPGYSKVITHRIDLGTMSDKISAHDYNGHESELSMCAERIQKEAQGFISMMNSQWRPEVVAKKFNIKMAKVVKRTGLRFTASTPALSIQNSNVVDGSRRLKFNVSKAAVVQVSNNIKDRGTETMMMRSRSTSLAAIAQKSSTQSIASPYWKPGAAAAGIDVDDSDRPAARSLRSRTNSTL